MSVQTNITQLEIGALKFTVHFKFTFLFRLYKLFDECVRKSRDSNPCLSPTPDIRDVLSCIFPRNNKEQYLIHETDYPSNKKKGIGFSLDTSYFYIESF